MVPPVASEKIPSDTTWDRSRDLPTSSAVPTLPQGLEREDRNTINEETEPLLGFKNKANRELNFQ
jgi:hypothetical protein